MNKYIVRLHSPFLGLLSYQWLLYFSSRTITSEPRKSCSWLSLSGLDCCLSRRILITNSTAEFTSVFMLVVEWCWWGEPMMLDVCICWNKILTDSLFYFFILHNFRMKCLYFLFPSPKSGWLVLDRNELNKIKTELAFRLDFLWPNLWINNLFLFFRSKLVFHSVVKLFCWFQNEIG